MPIYTRRGDTGTTRIYGTNNRRRKTDPRIVALGTVDELNAQLGVVLVHCTDRRVREQLERVQRDLFEIGAEIATESDSVSPFHVTKKKIIRLERWIDFYWTKLPPLANFIFPGGCLAAAQLHVARTVCRRAERVVFEWAGGEKVNPQLVAYLNRLSDFLLTLARWMNKISGTDDVMWVSGK